MVFSIGGPKQNVGGVGLDPSVKAPGSKPSGKSSVSSASAKKFQETKQSHKQHGTGKVASWFQKNVLGRLGGAKSTGQAKAPPPPWTPAQHGSSARHGLSEKFNDKTVVPGSVKKLGDEKLGQFNVPVWARFETTEIGGHRDAEIGEKRRIAKFEGPQVHSGRVDGVPIQRGVGVSATDARIVARNVATSIVDSHLGTDSVPKSKAGELDGKKIVAMSVAPGTEAKNVYVGNASIIHNPDFQRQMCNIEVNAFLSGNPDGHHNNYMIAFKKDEATGQYSDVKATMIDNDMSFGSRMTNPDEMKDFYENEPRAPNKIYQHTGRPAYMDAGTCERVKAMDVDKVCKELSEHLEPKEVDAFRSRCGLLKEHVAFLEENNRVVGDWETFTNKSGEPLDGESFIKGTLEMSGVQQGNKPGAEVFAPRSMILRDVVQSKDARREIFMATLSDADKQAVADWGHAEPKVVVPRVSPPVGQSVEPLPQNNLGQTVEDAKVEAQDGDSYVLEPKTEGGATGPSGVGQPSIQDEDGEELEYQDGGPPSTNSTSGGNGVGGGPTFGEVRDGVDTSPMLDADGDEITYQDGGPPATSSTSSGSGVVGGPGSDEIRDEDEGFYQDGGPPTASSTSGGNGVVGGPGPDEIRDEEEGLYQDGGPPTASSTSSGNAVVGGPGPDEIRDDEEGLYQDGGPSAASSTSGGNGVVGGPGPDEIRDDEEGLYQDGGPPTASSTSGGNGVTGGTTSSEVRDGVDTSSLRDDDGDEIVYQDGGPSVGTRPSGGTGTISASDLSLESGSFIRI